MSPEQTPSDYLSQLAPERQAMFLKIRELIREEIPQVEETMRYNMPTYELDEVVLSVASQKHYMSLYMDTELVAKHSDALAHLNCGKSCVRFKKLQELPLGTVRLIIRETVEKQNRIHGRVEAG